MADPPRKDIDRTRPFARINMSERFKLQPPDGDGVAAGCRVPETLGNVEKEFEAFLDSRLPIPVIDIVTKVRDAARAIAEAADKVAIAMAVLAALSPLLGIPVAGLLLFVGGVVAVIKRVADVIDTALDLIATAVRKFFSSIGKRMLQRAVRVIPQWVPVKRGASNERVDASQIVEVQGLATRSFGNPVDVPFFQWHRWFAWNVQVESPGLSPPDPPNQTGFKRGERPLMRPDSIEVQIDPAALFGREKAAAYEAGFPPTGDDNQIRANDEQMREHDGPMLGTTPSGGGDWAWPQAGSLVWASGRLVYDCSRVTEGANPRMCAMIHPARAIASARFKAVRLPGQAHGLSVPVVQFMFFASARGGYIDFETIADEDYEFIVDLPPAPAVAADFPIAHTGKIAHNTVVVRPRLLHDVQQLFDTDAKRIEPILEPVFEGDERRIFRQVKVRVPVAGQTGSVGFILSMGWFDPDFEQARKVLECTYSVDFFGGRRVVRDNGVATIREVFAQEEKELREELLKRVDQIEVISVLGATVHVGDVPLLRDLVHSMVNGAIDALFGLLQTAAAGKEEWLLRLGLNGMYVNAFDRVVDESPHGLKPTAQFPLLRLSEDDALVFSAHGIEFNPLGDMMRSSRANRALTDRDSPGAISWASLAEPLTDDAARKRWRDRVFDYVFEALFDTSGGSIALGLENNPVGIIDPDPSIGNAAGRNPLPLAGLGEGTFPVEHRARFARAVGDQCILAEDPTRDDYVLKGTFTVKRQQLPDDLK